MLAGVFIPCLSFLDVFSLLSCLCVLLVFHCYFVAVVLLQFFVVLLFGMLSHAFSPCAVVIGLTVVYSRSLLIAAAWPLWVCI